MTRDRGVKQGFLNNVMELRFYPKSNEMWSGVYGRKSFDIFILY